MSAREARSLAAEAADDGLRLDVFLARRKPDLSRARWQELIKAGDVLVNDKASKANRTLRESDRVTYEMPAPVSTEIVAQDIPFPILYEDADLLVMNKPPGIVVHPAPGHDDGTLVNALLHHCKDLAGIGGELRPGIVHRLDKDTSGAMVVAKSETAMKELAAQFKGRSVKKEYLTLVWGHLKPANGIVKTSIGRSPHDRKKMTAKIAGGREAISYYETVEAFAEISLVRVRIATGRTHQIRVHMAHLGHPVVGDTVYGRARKNDLSAPFDRQMLHAEKLTFTHPGTGKQMEFVAPLFEDMKDLLAALKA